MLRFIAIFKFYFIFKNILVLTVHAKTITFFNFNYFTFF